MRDYVIFGLVFGLLPFIPKRPVVGVLAFAWLSLMNPHRLTYGAAYNFPFAAIVAVVTLVITQLLNLIFVGPLAHAGLALATALGSCLNAGLLYYLLHKRAIHQPQPGWGVFLGKLLVAVLLMATALWFAAGEPQRWVTASASVRVMWLLGVVSLGASVYFAALWLMGFRWRDFARHESR